MKQPQKHAQVWSWSREITLACGHVLCEDHHPRSSFGLPTSDRGRKVASREAGRGFTQIEACRFHGLQEVAIDGAERAGCQRCRAARQFVLRSGLGISFPISVG